MSRAFSIGWIIFASLILLGAVLSACAPETKYRLLSTFLDGVPKPGEEVKKRERVKRVRHVVAKKEPEKKEEKEEAKKEEPKPEEKGVTLEKAKSWAEALNVIPKDVTGGPDWVVALKEGMIKPKAGLEPEAQDQPVLPLDFELVPANNPTFTARFPHSIHTQVLGCTNCHTEIFQMKKGTAAITMEKIMAGELCGRCHAPGRVAFSAAAGCPRCHAALAKAAPAQEKLKGPAKKFASWDQVTKELPKDAAGSLDWVAALREGLIAPAPGLDPKGADQPALDMDLELVPNTNPTFKAVFSHKVHTQWLACPNCHVGIFQMKKGSAVMDMPKIMAGEYCGRCHGKVAFAVATGCARCHPALAGK